MGGSARKKILKHDHEQDSGRTSCITHKYTKYDENTTLSFVDLAGHEKYYKTTIFGANCCSLDFVLLMIGANMGVSHMTREHLLLFFKITYNFCYIKNRFVSKRSIE